MRSEVSTSEGVPVATMPPLMHSNHAVAVAGREIDVMQHHHHGQFGARIPLRYRFHQGHVMRPAEIGVAWARRSSS